MSCLHEAVRRVHLRLWINKLYIYFLLIICCYINAYTNNVYLVHLIIYCIRVYINICLHTLTCTYIEKIKFKMWLITITYCSGILFHILHRKINTCDHYDFLLIFLTHSFRIPIEQHFLKEELPIVNSFHYKRNEGNGIYIWDLKIQLYLLFREESCQKSGLDSKLTLVKLMNDILLGLYYTQDITVLSEMIEYSFFTDWRINILPKTLISEYLETYSKKLVTFMEKNERDVKT